MNEKIFKVSSEDLDKMTKALNLCAALLGKIMLCDAIDSAELPDTPPATLEQAVDDQAERAMANLERRHAEKKAPCHCHCVKGGSHLVAVCPKPKNSLPQTIKEIAAATGATYKQVQKYAYSHNIGKAGKTLDGHQCRIFTAADVKAILKHFNKGVNQ